MRSKIILGVFAFVSAWLFWWLGTHGFIDVTVDAKQGGSSYTYIVMDKKGAEISRAKSASPHFRKLVKKDSYQLLVEGKGGSEYRLTKVGGFLGKTKLAAVLQPEGAREFVGNNPGFCMNYDGSLLFSYSCSEPGTLASHQPATPETPTTTFTEPVPTIPLRGLINYGGSMKAMVLRDDEAGGGVTLNYISPQLRLSNPVPLIGVAAENAAYLQPYKQGFVVYGKGLGVVNYFDSPSSRPVEIKSTPPSDNNPNPVEITIYKGSVGALFNSTRGGNDAGLDENAGATGTTGSSEYIFYGNDARSYKLNKAYTAGGQCGDNRLCLINSGVLDIYSLVGEKARLEFSLQNVQKVFTEADNIIIVTGERVISLSQSSLVGYVQYSFGRAIGYCGSGAAPIGYVLCVVAADNKTAALHIDTTRPDQTKIDQKVFSLLEDPNISSVSAYKNYVYVSPNLGELIFDASQGGYSYDPEVKRSTAKAINDLVKRLGIDTSKYSVINPYATN